MRADPWSRRVATLEVEGKVAGGRRGSTCLWLPSGPQHSTHVEQAVVGRERRPIGRSYVIPKGTFLIGSLGNYLIADS